MKPIHTLIADDSAMIVKIIKKALLANTSKDFHFDEKSIFTAADGMQAFEMMAEKPSIKLIISDINMPYLNGDEFIEILQDTNKINDVEILFVTSSLAKKPFKSDIQDKILGVIYKPFNTETFNAKMQKLHDEKLEKKIKLDQLKEIHKEQKKTIQKICRMYLKHFSLLAKPAILNAHINDNFHNTHVEESEYNEIVHSVLALYLFEIGETHTLENKRINCIIKSLNSETSYKENRFGFIASYEEQLQMIKDQEFTPKELLKELTEPLLNKISFAFADAKTYPKQNPKRFSKHFNYMIDELVKIDCDYVDKKLQLLLLDFNEINQFSSWLHFFISKDEVTNFAPNIRKSPVLHTEVVKRLKYAFKRILLLKEHYCGEIDSYIWKRAKSSKEIVSYLKKRLPKKMPNSLEFLLHKTQISATEYKQDYKLDKKNIVVLSNNISTLEIFKSICDIPFDNWHFYGFAKTNLFELWLSSNTVNMIIIDHSYTTAEDETAMEYIKTMIKSNPTFKSVINDHQLLIIASDNQVVELQKDTAKIEYTILNDKLSVSNISKTLLYT